MANYLKLFKLPEPFHFKRGGSIQQGVLAYETWGELNADKSNAILILIGLSANSHAARHGEKDTDGWWEYMVGPGKAIDTDRWFVVCASSLGSCKGSTGPCSPNPSTKQPYRFDFPDLTLEDIAHSSVLLCQSLGIEQLECLIGPSMGGMSAMALLAQYPAYARHMVNIASGLASPPFSTAIRSLQRESIIKDVNFNDGYYSAEQWPTEGMKFARKIGMLSYRSAEEWRERFPRSLKKATSTPFDIEFPVESYLEHHANRFVHTFDPISYLYLSRAMDWFDGNAYTTAENPVLKNQLKLQSALIIGAHTDLLFPPYLQQELTTLLESVNTQVDLVITDSIQGHDAFLVDHSTFTDLIREYLQNLHN